MGVLERELTKKKELAQKADIDPEIFEKAVQIMIQDVQSRKRVPAPPAPDGGISIRAAARKYQILSSTISDWRRDGLIKTVLETKNAVYIEESSLVPIAEAYKKNPGRGKRAHRLGICGKQRIEEITTAVS